MTATILVVEDEPAILDLIAHSLKLMSEQTIRMNRLVEDLLTLSRLENPRDAPVDENVNVPQLIQSLLQEAQAISGDHHKIRAEVNTHEWLEGSAVELRSAFANLASNAVRYTPDGGTIDLIWENRDGKPAFVVRDTGIGIERLHLARLTERFYRVDKSRSRETGGTGLGLAIVKYIANRHQARFRQRVQYHLSGDKSRNTTRSWRRLGHRLGSGKRQLAYHYLYRAESGSG